MSTYLTMITRIEDEIDDTAIRDQVKKAIVSAVAFYSSTKFYFNQKTFTFATVASQETYSVSDAADIETFIQVINSYVTSGGVRYTFKPVDYEELTDSQSGLHTGRPEAWAYFAQKFHVYPIPDAAYTATIAAHYKLTTLSADGDSNAWTTYAEEMIRQRAKRIIAMDITKEPSDALAAQALEEAARDALLAETRMRRGRLSLRYDPALLGGGHFDIRTGT